MSDSREVGAKGAGDLAIILAFLLIWSAPKCMGPVLGALGPKSLLFHSGK